MAQKDKQIGVRVDPETKEIIEKQLGYKDSVSAWVREAIERRIEDEDLGNLSQIPTAD